MSHYLGVDLGTASVKVVLFDADARHVLARGQAALAAPATPRPGAAEQDPQDWWRAFAQAMDQALQVEGVNPAAIRALGVSGQQHGLVALGAGNQVLRPAKLWCDVEAAAEAQEVSALVGYPVAPGFTAPKILWFHRHESHLAAQLQHVLLPHDWLNLQLTGNIATDLGDASGSGLMDPLSGSYLLEAAAAIDPHLPQQLAPIRGPQAEHGKLLAHLSARFGLPAELPVSIGSGDNMMSALGAGATENGSWVVSLGTSGTIFGPTAHAVMDPSGAVAPFRSALGGGLPLICTQNCSSVVEEARAASGRSHAELSAAAAALPLTEEDPLFLPYLRGERTPNWPTARGVLAGLRPGSLQPAPLYRAALEGASLALAQGFAALRACGLEIDTLRLVGGGAHNPLWARILCDLLERPLQVVEESETAAVGAAMQACWMASGTHPRELQATTSATPLEPDPAAAPRYRALQARFDALGQQLFG